MNNPTLGLCCEAMIGRADIEESKSNVAMNAWLPQASYPCGNFSVTSSQNLSGLKGSIGHAFAVRIRTGNQNQADFFPFNQQEISVLFESTLGHLRCNLADVPPQPNSPSDYVPWQDWMTSILNTKTSLQKFPNNRVSRATLRVVVFQFCSKLLPRMLHPPSHSTKSD